MCFQIHESLGTDPGEALVLFTQLSSDDTRSDFQRADAMEQAVECLLQLEQFDEAKGRYILRGSRKRMPQSASVNAEVN